MATEKWIAGSGVGLTWTDAFSTATLNSIANGNSILSDVTISNGTALDMFADISVNIASLTTAAPFYLGFYLYPLDKDGSTYGDGRFASSAAGIPGTQYYVGSIVMPPVTTTATAGTYRQIVLPPGTFKFVLYNQLGATLASSGNTCQYRTYNRQIA